MRESQHNPDSKTSRFSLMEGAMAVLIVAVILAAMLPLLNAARTANNTTVCAHHQASIFPAWQSYIDDHGAMPLLIDQPGWRYGGVRFSSTYSYPYLDYSRPLNRYMLSHDAGRGVESLFRCPADTGVVDATFDGGEVRTAYEAFGTSYRANRQLLSAAYAGLGEEHREVHLSEITADPSSLLLMGDAFWREHVRRTGRLADWHGQSNAGNLLFFDGSVRFVQLGSHEIAVTLSPGNN